MTDDSLPNTDAARAREGMVDELKTINKYEEMADESKDPDVADTLREVADDERVHVGNFGALVAAEDPKAVPKMMEGIQETAKDTGLRFKGIDQLIQSNVDEKITKSDGGYAFRRARGSELPEGWHYNDNGELELDEAIMDAKSPQEIYDELVESIEGNDENIAALKSRLDEMSVIEGKADVDLLVDDLLHVGNVEAMEIVLSTIHPDSIDFVKNELKRNGDFRSLKPEMRNLLLASLDEAKHTNLQDLQRYERLVKTNEKLRERKDILDGKAPTKLPTTMELIGQAHDEADAIMAQLKELNIDEIAEAISRVSKGGKPIEFESPYEAAKALLESPAAYQWNFYADAPVTEKLVPLIKGYKEAIRKEYDLRQRYKELKTEANRKKQKVGTPEEARILEYLDGVKALNDRINEQRAEIDAEAKDVSDLYGISIEDARTAIEARPYNELAAQYKDVIAYLQLQADKNWADIGVELRKRLVENGVYDERNWAKWAKDGAAYNAQNRYTINPYGYEMDEGQIDQFITDMPKLDEAMKPIAGSHYALPSKRWFQGISDALWDGSYPRMTSLKATPPMLKEQDTFPSNTQLSKNRTGIDAFGALEKIGVTNVGQLRKFLKLWENNANEIYQSYKRQGYPSIPQDKFKEELSMLKAMTVDAWTKEMGIELDEEDYKYIDANLVGLGFAGTNSVLKKLIGQIEDLSDDVLVRPVPLVHPELTKDMKGEYEQWIRDNFIKTSPYIYKTVFTPLWDAINGAYNGLASKDPAVRQNVLRSFESVAKNFMENSILGDKDVRYLLKDDPIGAQLVEFLKNVSNKMMAKAPTEEDRLLWERVSEISDNLKDRLLRKIYGTAFVAQSDARFGEAEDIARENYDRVDALLGYRDQLPPLVINALEDMKHSFDVIIGIDKDHKMQDEYRAIDKILGKNFETYGEDLLNGLETLIETGAGADRSAYDMHDIEPKSLDALASAMLSNSKIAKQYADAVEEIDPSLAERLRTPEYLNSLGEGEDRKEIIDDIKATLPTIVGMHPHDMRMWLSRYGGNPGARTHALNHAAELYLISGSGGKRGQLGYSDGETIDEAMGGTGLPASESERLYDDIKGIKHDPIKGYETPVIGAEEDENDTIASNDEFIKRRLDAILHAVSIIDDPLSGVRIGVRKGDNVDEGIIVTPAEVGYTPRRLEYEMKKDPEGTINEVLRRMHERGVVTRMDFNKEEFPDVLPNLIQDLNASDSWDISGTVAGPIDPEARYKETQSEIEGNKPEPIDVDALSERIEKDKELNKQIEEKKKYDAQVRNLNMAQLHQEQAYDHVRDAVGQRQLRRDILYSGKKLPEYLTEADKMMGNADVLTPKESMAAAKNDLEMAKLLQDRALNSGVKFKTENPKYSPEFHERYRKKVGPKGLVIAEPETSYDQAEEKRGQAAELVDRANKNKAKRDEMIPMLEEAKKTTAERVQDAMKVDNVSDLVDEDRILELDDAAHDLAFDKRQLRRYKIGAAKDMKKDVKTAVKTIEALDPMTHPDQYILPDIPLEYQPVRVGGGVATGLSLADEPGIVRSATSFKKSERPPLRVRRVFSQAIPFYGVKLDLNDNEPFDAAKYKTVKKEVQGSKRTNIDSLIAGRQKQ